MPFLSTYAVSDAFELSIDDDGDVLEVVDDCCCCCCFEVLVVDFFWWLLLLSAVERTLSASTPESSACCFTFRFRNCSWFCRCWLFAFCCCCFGFVESSSPFAFDFFVIWQRMFVFCVFLLRMTFCIGFCFSLSLLLRWHRILKRLLATRLMCTRFRRTLWTSRCCRCASPMMSRSTSRWAPSTKETQTWRNFTLDFSTRSNHWRRSRRK